MRRLGGEAARRRVLVDAAERRRIIAEGIAGLATRRQMAVVDDPGLLDEVAGLVEWPVPLLGRIDEAYMDLPAEVRQVSMRVNQRYFAFRNADGRPHRISASSPIWQPTDGGATSLRATSAYCGRGSPMRAISGTWTGRGWIAGSALDQSRSTRAGPGGPGAPAGAVAERSLQGGAGPARRVTRRSWRRRTSTGMVGEFPELQGVMGGYYALHDGEERLVAEAIRDHYAPRGTR